MLSCRECPLRDRAIFDPMTESEIDFMERFKTGELEVERGAMLMQEGAASPHMYTVLNGVGLRYKTLETGKRQVINFVFPGDFIGLQAGVMGEMKHSVEASTDMTLCVFNRASLWSLFENHAERAYDLTWMAAVEEHLLGEHLAVIGHMSGEERIARAFVHIHDRGKALGLVKGTRMTLPFRQQDLADALGLSLVHTNKTLGALRTRGVVRWSDGTLEILDYEALCDAAQLAARPEPLTRPLL